MVTKSGPKGIPAQYLYNAAGGLFLLVTAVLVGRYTFFKEPEPRCEMRYARAMQFALKSRHGEAETAAGLQARLAGRDWGVAQHAKVVAGPGGNVPYALEVAMPAGASVGARYDQPGSGLGFTWPIEQLSSANSACLGYSLWLPSDFEFGPGGGTLPGFYGGTPVETHVRTSQTPQFFATPFRWIEGGKLEMRIISTERIKGDVVDVDPTWTRLPRGQWVHVEQEVRLNTPGAADGLVRVWVDGKLVLERDDLVLRDGDGPGFAGVVANTHYGLSHGGWTAAPAPTAIRMSPFLVRW